MRLPVTELRATYRAKAPFRLPDHSGSLFRGLLGRALRRTACARSLAPCAGECEKPADCFYTNLFDPIVPAPTPHRFLQPATEAPPRLLPLIPSVDPPEPVELATGDELPFALRVLGVLDDDGERRLLAALEAIAKLPFGTRAGVFSLDTVGRWEQRNRDVNLDPANAVEPSVRRISVTFDTPAWIEHSKKLVERLTFPLLFRALYRRLTMLCALYGQLDEQDEVAFASLNDLAGTVRTIGSNLRPYRWERLSEERGERHWMRGILGEVTFEGDLQTLAPIIKLGEIVHVGKSTGFGLGRMSVKEERG